jgi:hypothetical protein
MAVYRHLQQGWRLQRYLLLVYVAIGFMGAMGAHTLQLPTPLINAVLPRAHTLSQLATAAWNPDGARSWFATMLLLGIAWTLPLALAFSRGVLAGSIGSVLARYLPLSAVCLFLAWGFVDGLGRWIPDLAGRGGRTAQIVQLVVGSAYNLGLYGSILMLITTVLACMPFGMLFVLGKRRDGTRGSAGPETSAR